MLTRFQKFNSQYESASNFKAHEGRVLASQFVPNDGKPLYITGSNDRTISLWDVSDCINDGRNVPKTSNGKSV